MFLPLVDILRCVNPHEETWLVASIVHADQRDILEGTLGCPICQAEYPIREGVVDFGGADRTTNGVGRETDALRLAAALDLTEPRMTAVLQGRWGANAQLVRGISPAQLLLLNGPTTISSGDGVSIVVARTAPFAQGAVDAVAVDETADDGMLQSLVRSLRAKGRMLAPLAMPLPDGVVELARDNEVWIARLESKISVSAPVQLGRR